MSIITKYVSLFWLINRLNRLENKPKVSPKTKNLNDYYYNSLILKKIK